MLALILAEERLNLTAEISVLISVISVLLLHLTSTYAILSK